MGACLRMESRHPGLCHHVLRSLRPIFELCSFGDDDRPGNRSVGSCNILRCRVRPARGGVDVVDARRPNVEPLAVVLAHRTVGENVFLNCPVSTAFVPAASRRRESPVSW